MARKERPRYTFTERRKLILDSIDLLQDTFGDMTFDEFERDWRNVDSARMRLTAIGELLREGAGHSPGFAQAFTWFRNMQAHDYFRSPTEEVWDMLAVLDDFRKEVLMRTHPRQSEVRQSALQDRGGISR